MALSDSLDVYFATYEKIVTLGDFNVGRIITIITWNIFLKITT